jgi:hypothetical protein
MSNDNNNNDNNSQPRIIKRRTVGVPTPDADAKHREKALTSGRRRNQGVIKIRDTGDDNYMNVVRANHERRKILDDEAKRGLPKDLIYDPKKPINSMELFKDEVGISSPTKRKPGDTPVTQA